MLKNKIAYSALLIATFFISFNAHSEEARIENAEERQVMSLINKMTSSLQRGDIEKVMSISGYNFSWKDSNIKERGGEDGYFVRKKDVGIVAQEIEKKKLKDRVNIGGYVKSMNTTSVANLDSIITDNLIHNRIKIKAELSDNLSAVVEMRNRIFYGEATKLNPLLGSILDHDLGQVDLSFVLLDKNSRFFSNWTAIR